jgi:serine/threonine-protein kinase
MSFDSGDRLGPYEIRAKIGEGGMGAVYRAVDPRLGREVAIKVLPAAFVGDPERRARFEREAKLLAALNHPNIAQLYGVEEGPAGTLALVMELVEGTQLDDRLAAGALPVDEALAIAGEIAAALADAHDKGIVHRDLKPQNVRLTPGGSVKVLDFGLAKALDATTSGSSSETLARSPTLMNSPTLAGATELGVILGTAAYMSPEQARGRPIDRRADVWAFGCVLFEMLTGERLFSGETATDTLAAVLRREIPWERLPAGLPYPVRLLLRRCLERDPKQRLRDLGDAALLLREVDDRAPAPAAPPARSWLPIAGALAAAVLGIALGWGFARRGAAAPSSAKRPAVLAIRLPGALALNMDSNLGQTQMLAITRDGSTLAFVASEGGRQKIYLRRLDAKAVVPVPGSEGGTTPFFSPDGRSLGFFSNGKLRRTSIAGGDPVVICDAGLDRGALWLADNTIVFTPETSTPLFRVSAAGGTPAPFSTLDETAGERSHRWPALLPGGREIAFTVGSTSSPGDYEGAAIDAVEIATGKRRRLFEGASMIRFTSTGHALLGHEGEVEALPFGDAGLDAVEGAKVLLDVGGVPASGLVYFDVADDGTLVYSERAPNNTERSLSWVDPTGKVTPLPAPPREYRIPRLSPDGKRIAVGIGRGGGGASDIWLVDAASGALQRLTFDGKSANPLWSRDGQSVIYLTATPRPGLFAEKRADGTAEPRLLSDLGSDRARGPVSIAPDGSLLFSEDSGPRLGIDVLVLAPGDPKPRVVAQTAAAELAGGLSPDGRYVAYSINTSGSSEYVVQSFPSPTGRWQVAQGSNGTLRWAPDGRALYIRGESGMMRIPVDVGPPFRSGAAELLFNLPFFDSDDTYTNFDVAADGRVLVVRRTSEEPVWDRIVVHLDWFETLRRLAPVER